MGVLDNSHISEPTLEPHSRAAPVVGGITAQLVLPQGEIPEEGRTEKKTKRITFYGIMYISQSTSQSLPRHPQSVTLSRAPQLVVYSVLRYSVDKVRQESESEV